MGTGMVEDPVGRQRFAFTPGTDDDGTEIMLVECWVDPGGGVSPHIHPHQTEIFEVIEGEITFTAGRSKELRRAGESITVPPGTRHTYENKSSAPAYMRCTARPAADLKEFLETAAALGREGHLVRIGPLRAPGPRGLPKVAAMLKRHRENTLILMPPPLVQRVLLDRLARFADR